MTCGGYAQHSQQTACWTTQGGGRSGAARIRRPALSLARRATRMGKDTRVGTPRESRQQYGRERARCTFHSPEVSHPDTPACICACAAAALSQPTARCPVPRGGAQGATQGPARGQPLHEPPHESLYKYIIPHQARMKLARSTHGTGAPAQTRAPCRPRRGSRRWRARPPARTPPGGARSRAAARLRSRRRAGARRSSLPPRRPSRSARS